MEIVINEWLLHYSKADSDLKKKKIAYNFLVCLQNKQFKIIVNWSSKFKEKFYHFWEDSKHDDRSNILFKLLSYLLFNSDKTELLMRNGIELIPSEIIKICPDDDLYLLELAYYSKDRIIITMDERLIDRMKGHSDIRFFLPEEFLKNCCG